jgi:hypothetical protein
MEDPEDVVEASDAPPRAILNLCHIARSVGHAVFHDRWPGVPVVSRKQPVEMLFRERPR